jgi:cytochrome c-type biogenesis protein CcmH/NrfF
MTMEVWNEIPAAHPRRDTGGTRDRATALAVRVLLVLLVACFSSASFAVDDGPPSRTVLQDLHNSTELRCVQCNQAIADSNAPIARDLPTWSRADGQGRGRRDPCRDAQCYGDFVLYHCFTAKTALLWLAPALLAARRRLRPGAFHPRAVDPAFDTRPMETAAMTPFVVMALLLVLGAAA